MNKIQDRKKAKALLIARAIIDIEACEFKARNADNIAETIMSFHKGAYLDQRLKNITQINFRCLRVDGRIDSRRHRRFVTKHKQAIKITPNIKLYNIVKNQDA